MGSPPPHPFLGTSGCEALPAPLLLWCGWSPLLTLPFTPRFTPPFTLPVTPPLTPPLIPWFFPLSTLRFTHDVHTHRMLLLNQQTRECVQRFRWSPWTFSQEQILMLPSLLSHGSTGSPKCGLCLRWPGGLQSL